MTTEYIYQSIMINIRIPLNEDGTVGKPEILQRFVMDGKKNSGATKHKKKDAIVLKTTSVQQQVWD